jgi:hypothetical protein
MEESSAFLQKLEEVLEKRRVYLDTERLPSLKESFRVYQTHMDSLLNMLIKKGLVEEDPYKYDQRIAELSLPPDDTFLETEKDDELSYRLSAYRRQLEHISSYTKFSVATLDMAQLKRISSMLGYIQWRSLSDLSKSPTTRALAACVSKVRGGSDTMAAGIVKDALLQLDKVTSHINAVLHELASFYRETFKCELRGKVLSEVPLDAQAIGAKRNDALRSIKKAFTRLMTGKAYYPELVGEILNEDFGQDSDLQREKLLDSLAVVERRKEEEHKTEKISYKEILFEAVRTMSRAAPDISSGLDVLAEDDAVASGGKVTLVERIRRWIERRLRGKEEEHIYEIEYFEGDDPRPRQEKLVFLPFMEAGRKKVALLNSLANRAGAVYRRLESAKEDQILEFVSTQLVDLQLLHRRMGGLNSLFPIEVPRAERQNIKTIKIQLVSFKNAILKANQKKHEYVARREEEEQLKRLGIK